MFNLIPWRRTSNNGGRLTRLAEHPLSRLHDEFDALFDQFFGNWPLAPQAWERGWGMNLEETEKEVVFRTDAPGFEVEDFEIQLNGDVLTVKAERKAESKDKEAPVYTERSLHRSIALPAGADPDKVEARYRNGVLEVRIAKTEEAQPKKIPVQAS